MKYCLIGFGRVRSESPSPRRAWIEILWRISLFCPLGSRPPHGGRGLKYALLLPPSIFAPRRPPHGGRGLKSVPPQITMSRYLSTSPSPRRAWIEILWRISLFCPLGSRPPHGGRGLKYALLLPPSIFAPRRPPHGGRGLKSVPPQITMSRYLSTSPSPRRAWIEILWRISLFCPLGSRPPHGGRGLKYLQRLWKRF